MGYFWTEEVVNARLEQTMVNAFNEVHATAKKHGVSLRRAAYILALDRVVTVYRMRGIFS
jgi:glutamate dehydrogenase/leucine dehydrogenase